MTDEPWRLGAAKTAAAIASRKLSAVEAVRSHLARLDAANGPVNAVTVRLDEAALKAAHAADAAVKAGGPLGPLHGVPVTIKENADQAGLANTNGLPANKGLIAPRDAVHVAAWIEAGAIPIARTNTPEFSYRWHTKNPLWGETLNPWDRARTPGGSSGGAAAAVALGIGAVAHGNDLGGSLRYPAYCCGVATIKPSHGRVAAYNFTQAEERPPAIQMMSVNGPIARNVADVRLALKLMARPSPHDPWAVPVPFEGPPPPRPIRVAFCLDPFGAGIDPAVADAVRRAAGHLAEAGYAVEEKTPPLMPEAGALWGKVAGAEMQTVLGAGIRTYGSAEVNKVIDAYAAPVGAHTLETYMRALAERTRLIREWQRFQETHPLVLMPVSAELAFKANDDASSPARSQSIFAANRFLFTINLLGLPSAAVPTGLAGEIPVGVQIVGPRFREDLCLDAAQAIEDRAGTLYQALWNRTGG